MNQLPGYLHIGFSKAASTWLQRFLEKEEDVYLVYKTYFFFPLSSNKYKKGIRWYKEHFKNTSKKKIVIESQEHIILPYIHPELKCACTNNKGVETISKRIKENLPNAKIIIIIRNQADMLISRYTQYILQGGKLDGSIFFDKLMFSSDCWIDFVDYRYSKIIKILHEVFGKQNVLVLFQEELKTNQNNFINDLSKFMNLNISSFNTKKSKSTNVAPSYWGVKIIQLINRALVKEIETIESRTKTRGPYLMWVIMVKITRIIDNFLVGNKRKYKLLKKEELKKIHQIFSIDNRNLAKLFNKPIREYGYFY